MTTQVSRPTAGVPHGARVLVSGAMFCLTACGARSSLLDAVVEATVQSDGGLGSHRVDALADAVRDGSATDGPARSEGGPDATPAGDALVDSADAAGHPMGDGACSRLGACCASMGQPAESVCMSVAKMGNVVGCALLLQDGSAHETCAPSDGTVIGGPACRALGACCPAVPAAELQACVAVADQCDDVECAGAVALAQSRGMCVSSDGSDGGG